MTKEELYEAVTLLDTVYLQFNNRVLQYNYADQKQGVNLLKVVSVLNISSEFKGTPAEAFLNKAVSFAALLDCSKIDVVFEMVREIKKYIEESSASKKGKKNNFIF
ncbi:MAG TPA: hypothetical protein PLB12_02340 [Candidatus Goldiibacteriota bacterium]|nr:hypothetical protein [Candidatus Goldiibacteriota bacterium]HPI04334.1 hypothetical protein [Candidatus Goldiibacteriota bacterium]HPN64910.1 hypothetical protein [Candidatus Goldiibacteriota bacterium]HRQ43173.1 hypothetical protein [Candidatus Goldiibacteriota bacterium]